MAADLYVIEVLVAELDVVGGDVVELVVAEVDMVGLGVVEVVVDEEIELVVGVMAFVYDSLSHDMLLDVGLDLQNLHISYRPPLKYTVNYNMYIYYTHTHKIKWAFCLSIPLQKSTFDYCTYCLASG